MQTKYKNYTKRDLFKISKLCSYTCFTEVDVFCRNQTLHPTHVLVKTITHFQKNRIGRETTVYSDKIDRFEKENVSCTIKTSRNL